jgi:hypothetical protein
MLKRCTMMAIHRKTLGAAFHDHPQNVQTIFGCMPVTAHVHDLFTCSACANLFSSVDQNVRQKGRLVWRSLDPRLRATGFIAVLSILPAGHHGIWRCAPLLIMVRKIDVRQSTTDYVFDPSNQYRLWGRFIRLSSQGLISAAVLSAVLSAVLAALILTTEAFADEQPKTDKTLLSDHRGDATITTIGGIDTGRAEVKFKREFDDVIKACIRSIGTGGNVPTEESEKVGKCTRKGLQGSGPTGASADEQPKTDKILLSDHRGNATIIMISGVDTGRAVATFKREIDDIVEDCVRTAGNKNEADEVSSDEVVKCAKESFKAWSKDVRTRRANCGRSTLFMEFGNYTLIDYDEKENGSVRTNWKSHKDNTIIDHCTPCGTSLLVDTYRVLCPSRYKAAFDGLQPY